jgi:hypothetical protein
MSQNFVGPFWFPGHFGINGKETTDEIASEVSVYHFVGSEPALRIYRAEYKGKYKVLACKPAHDIMAGS